ncbi:hypothetical protein KM043_013560 [Ampulex compressa]|nr:hypothetical protein KM043_013560 [Ampulex compressa]
MINAETSTDFINTHGSSTVRLSNSRPDLLEPISFGSEVRLLALEQQLQELREQISDIVKKNERLNHTNNISAAPIQNGNDDAITVPLKLQSSPPPAPPPPPPLPTTPHIARRASLQDHKVEDRKKSLLNTQKSMSDMLHEIDNVKLKPIARSPGGRPLRIKRENSPCNDLQEILRKRYMAMQSPDSRNTSTTLSIDNSF